LADAHLDGQEHQDRATPSGQDSGGAARAVLREIQQVLCRKHRLEALRRTALLDTPTEEAFDRLARLAVRLTRAPIGLVTLVDRDRQFFKSCVGLPSPWCDVRQTPLTHSFCMHVVATGEPLVIEDARQHPILRENLAVDQLGVVAYAGVPLSSSEGENIGTLCVIDNQPRVWLEDDLRTLKDLAVSVMTEIELRSKQRLETQMREVEAARQRFTLLADLSAILAESFDLRSTLERAVRLVVPRVADGCMVELLGEDNRLRRVVVVHRDSDEEVKLRSQPESFALLAPEPAGAPQLLGLVRLSGPEGSTLRLPLTSHGRVLGVATFLSLPSRQMSEFEAVLAREVARRLALAVENARLYLESREAIQLRDRFLSIASHELRTPLTVLRLQAQSLLRGATSSARSLTARTVVDKVRVIARQVERLGYLVEELLDISRLTEGGLAFQCEDVDLTEVVREVVERFRQEMVQAHSALVLQGMEGPVMGQWNRPRLEQVVINLLTNAIKYGQGRPITLALRVDEEFVWFSVRDEGIGIVPRDQGRIFERFERAVSEQHYGGFGLGLWIVREIVRGLGGSISVCSELGMGATFTVELPRRPRQEPAPVFH
jgi:signal transduction histidine kinase